MGFIINVKRSSFFQELSSEEQKDFFDLKVQKFVPAIDNIYYSCFIQDDSNDNKAFNVLFSELEKAKKLVKINFEPVEFFGGMFVDTKSFQIYKYCVSSPDLFDIFIIDYLPNKDTPRILIQLRAYGLWCYGAEEMLKQSYNSVYEMLNNFSCSRIEIKKCRENRIDFCYHTNAITNPEKIFSDENINNTLKTTLHRWHMTGRIDSKDNKVMLKKDYFALGVRKSNNVFVRFYNKALEVVEEGYKAFFLEMWFNFGLINLYDKFCLEYAFEKKSYEYVHKAKLMFYVKYGKDNLLISKCKAMLKDDDMRLVDFKNFADSFMPDITTVMNVEYETKRRFYYFSDSFIDSALKTFPRLSPAPLNRIFKIIDNKALFLDYLTSQTACFISGYDDKKPVFCDWWERLRRVKLDGFKADGKLLREYTHKLDFQNIQRRFINNIATSSVYNQSDDKSGFISDICDLLSNINDNDICTVNIGLTDSSGKSVDLSSKLLYDYQHIKSVKRKRLKNRLNND